AYNGFLATRLGYWERQKGNYAKAEQHLQRAISINEKTLGKEDPQTAWSYNVMGLVYRSRNDDARAEPYLQSAIEVTEKTLGTDHGGVVGYVVSMAGLDGAHDDLQSSVKELERALAITNKALEPDDYMVMALSYNLGDTYLTQGDYDRAEPLTLRSLNLAEQRYGPEHPNLAIPLRNLGIIARERKQYARALEYFN